MQSFNFSTWPPLPNPWPRPCSFASHRVPLISIPVQYNFMKRSPFRCADISITHTVTRSTKRNTHLSRNAQTKQKQSRAGCSVQLDRRSRHVPIRSPRTWQGELELSPDPKKSPQKKKKHGCFSGSSGRPTRRSIMPGARRRRTPPPPRPSPLRAAEAAALAPPGTLRVPAAMRRPLRRTRSRASRRS